MILSFIRKFGILKALLIVSIAGILASNILYLIIGHFLIGKYEAIGFLMSCLVPGILAPLLSYFFVKVLYQLDTLEESLRESEERFRTLSELAEEGIAIHKNGTILDANMATSRIFGYELSEFRGTYAEKFFTPDSWKTILTNIASGYEKPYETIGIKKDGSNFVCQITGKQYKSQEGKYYRVAILLDISAQKKAEKEKAKLEARLQRAEKMEAIGTLAGGVAHDLNNILTGIVSYPDLILMQLPENSPIIRSVQIIQKAGEKASTIVQDLLTLSRKGVSINKIVNLNDLIVEYTNGPEYDKLISSRPGITLNTTLEAERLNISGSSVHLSKTITYLISNAFEAIADKGNISISTANRYIDSPVKGYDEVNKGDYAVITISDTGFAISAEDIANIFEPFYTKKKMGRKGTGLEMAVVWGCINDHRGYIETHSTEAEGTTFNLYFPITNEESPESLVNPYIHKLKGRGESILVVDDIKEQRDIMSQFLTILGYTVKTVSSGEKAVEFIKEKPADLLLLDMIMDPGIDGLDTYREISKIYPSQKAIIVSGYSEDKRVKEAQALGARSYIQKPYTLETLGNAVKEELCRN